MSEQAAGTLVLRPGRGRSLVLAAFFLLLLVFFVGSLASVEADRGIWMLLTVVTLLFGWLAAECFANALVQDFAFIKLAPKGFTVCRCMRQRTWRWSDIEQFTTSGSGLKRIVGFNVKAGIPISPYRSLVRALNGFAYPLPDTYGRSPDQLAAQLEDWRVRYGSSPGGGQT